MKVTNFRKHVYGWPTLIMSGFLVAFMWTTIATEVPANAWTLPTSTDDVVRDFQRIHDAMPNMDTFFGLREVFRKINEGIR